MSPTFLESIVAVALVMMTAGFETGQRGWVMPGKSGSHSSLVPRSRPTSASLRAQVGTNANGIYCTPLTENGVGIHHLGSVPAGLHIIVTIESFSEDFDPVAAVIVSKVGEKAGNNVRVATFYDNDSGGEGDPRVDFVTPQEGDYLLLVGDYTDAAVGCYRYEVSIR